MAGVDPGAVAARTERPGLEIETPPRRRWLGESGPVDYIAEFLPFRSSPLGVASKGHPSSTPAGAGRAPSQGFLPFGDRACGEAKGPFRRVDPGSRPALPQALRAQRAPERDAAQGLLREAQRASPPRGTQAPPQGPPGRPRLKSGRPSDRLADQDHQSPGRPRAFSRADRPIRVNPSSRPAGSGSPDRADGPGRTRGLRPHPQTPRPASVRGAAGSGRRADRSRRSG